MKTKIFYGNQYIESFNCDGKRYTRWQLLKYRMSWFARKVTYGTLAVMSIYVFGYAFFLTGATVSPVTVHAERVVEVPIKEIPPVMKRIAKCESGGQHYKNGQVVINPTQDAGLYQINLPVWSKTATKMGLNLMVESDNEAFAMYLYENYGTEPWYSSKKCWQ